ncbi:sigma-70 family RNA polymerase sigma factor [Pseudomonas sp. CF161]|uniref:sigma-70 family RNA polymerase sigma factor n=1 Tax=Pseudomonas sp. CF161 TaxID=911241 RepID=UPI00042672FB|nr:sigma-70 family RNA polymerase sigma factor [Pseudomonas sp. CF161]
MPADNHPPCVESLYRAHNSWLRRWLYSRLSNAADAADLAQDTFVRVLQRRLAAPLDQPRAYLQTVARGLVIDLWRHRDIERAWLETLAQLPEEYALSPETSALAMECLVAIDRLLDQLRPEVRQAFLLAQLEGLKCPAIAQRMSVSVATVERYIAKALRHCYAATFESTP